MSRPLLRIISRTFVIAWLAFVACSAAMAAPPLKAIFPRFESNVTPASQPDGKVVYAGYAYHANWNGYDFAVVRLNADGTPDAAFGAGGMVQVPIWGDYEFGRAIVIQPDGKIVIGGIASDPATGWMCGHPAFCTFYSALARLNVDGTVDFSFNGSGKIVFLSGDVTPGTEEDQGYIRSLVLQADGKVAVLYDVPSLMARINADGTLDESLTGMRNREVDFVTVIEYYNMDLDHYFLASDPSEAASLDNTPGGAWRRTGFGFHSYAASKDGGLQGLPVCRLHGTRSAELSTHFFTADPNECDDLADHSGGAWQLESRDAFRVAAPDMRTGACPAGQRPVYRLLAVRSDWSHRFTTNPRERDRMLIQEGYVPEGFGPDQVAMCAAP